MKNIHEEYMKRVLELAKKGEGKVNPNPLVGCVIVKDNKVISEGYHEKYGEYHAERNAINKLKRIEPNLDLSDSTLYVNLEPCCHYGQTPPCTKAIIESGIKKVVIGALDVNDKVSGKGISELKENGIEIISGILEEDCLEINEIFYHYIKNKTPFVLIKYAMTMDGKIASYTGHSKWITSEKSRLNVHKTRNKYSAIMIGINTVIKDDPMLNCRLENGNNPIRIILDSKLNIPINSNIIKTSKEIKTIIASLSDDNKKIKELENYGVEVLKTKNKNNQIDLNDLMKNLGKMGIDSILLEGGGTLNYSALEEKIVNKVQTYIAPKIIGSNKAVTAVGGQGIDNVNKAFMLKNQKLHRFEPDFMIESEVDYSCLQE